MRGLKIIPLFLGLMVLVFVGMRFVDANRDEVVVSFASRQTPPTALGFVVLTSCLAGMLICGVLCSFEILALYVQNRKLRRKLLSVAQQQKTRAEKIAGQEAQDVSLTGRPEGAR